MWWPVAARAIGVTIGVAQAVGYALGARVDASLMTFAAGLILAPNIAGSQQRRNDDRDDIE